MNRDMLMAGLEHYSCSLPSHDPSQRAFVYTETIGPDHPVNQGGRHRGDKLRHSLMWYEVAAAALARIEALEKAEWYVKLDEHEQLRYLRDFYDTACRADANARRLQELNATQAETIRRLQRELDEANQALRV